MSRGQMRTHFHFATHEISFDSRVETNYTCKDPYQFENTNTY